MIKNPPHFYRILHPWVYLVMFRIWESGQVGVIHMCMCTSNGISTGKENGGMWESGRLGVVPKFYELSTKLSTSFSTRFADIRPQIHRLYYYNYSY